MKPVEHESKQDREKGKNVWFGISSSKIIKAETIHITKETSENKFLTKKK